jgi:hypothetical protein
VIALTTISRNTVAISRRMMNVITVRATGARPGRPGRAPVASSLSGCYFRPSTA